MSVPVGVNTLQAILPNMSEKAGTSVRYTNHSMRATSATRLFSSGIPEKVIQEKTGHHSFAGLHACEKTTVEQEHAATRVVTSKLKDGGTEDNKDEVSVEQDKKPVVAVFSCQRQNCVINLYCDSERVVISIHYYKHYNSNNHALLGPTVFLVCEGIIRLQSMNTVVTVAAHKCEKSFVAL